MAFRRARDFGCGYDFIAVVIDNAGAAYSLKLSYQGKALGSRFINRGIRSAFLATFRK